MEHPKPGTMLHRALSESLADFGMSHLLDRITFETTQRITVRRKTDKAEVNLAMWDFMLIENKGTEYVVPLPLGRYEMDVGECLPGAEFPINMRVVRVGLDGSKEKWVAVMNAPMN